MFNELFFISEGFFSGLLFLKFMGSEFLPHVVYLKVGIVFDLDVC
jgi:hypothetical protein